MNLLASLQRGLIIITRIRLFPDLLLLSWRLADLVCLSICVVQVSTLSGAGTLEMFFGLVLPLSSASAGCSVTLLPLSAQFSQGNLILFFSSYGDTSFPLLIFALRGLSLASRIQLLARSLRTDSDQLGERSIPFLAVVTMERFYVQLPFPRIFR